jgi:hypothetical protein
MTEVLLICVDDTKIPKEIPINKRVINGHVYHAIKISRCQPQNKMAVWLEEIDLDESCAPFEYWLLDRFALLDVSLEAFKEMIGDHPVDQELLRETEEVQIA